MNIGELATKARVNVQTLRYYERVGILKPALRRDSGYRVYDQQSLRRLIFIRRSQELGFSLQEIQELLGLRAPGPASRERAREKAQTKLLEVRSKISILRKLERQLGKLVRECELGQESEPCPILAALEQE